MQKYMSKIKNTIQTRPASSTTKPMVSKVQPTTLKKPAARPSQKATVASINLNAVSDAKAKPTLAAMAQKKA